MPKSKPSQVIVHRIELQQSERDMLELAVAGRTATNAVSAIGSVFSGVGTMLAPFAPAFGLLTALWIGDRTLDVVKEDAERRKQEIETEYSQSKARYDALISAWLNTRYAEGGWDAVCDWETNVEQLNYGQTGMDPQRRGLGERIPLWYFVQFLVFLQTVCNSANLGDKTPSELWVEWMTAEEYGQAAYYHDTNGSTWEGFKKGLGTLLD
jgi:predicted outer membrane lipoprotein